jgi:hypothetical protein
MKLTAWIPWLKRLAGRTGRVQYHSPPPRTGTPRRSFVPHLDALEDRTVPSAMHDVLHIGNHGSLNDRTDAQVKHLDVARGAYHGTSVAVDSTTLDSPGRLVSGGQDTDNRAPDLGAFQNLQVPAGNKVAFHAYAEGVQIYRWDGASWTFVAPEAVLFASPGGGVIGTHYAGPTWESASGGKVVGAVVERGTPDPNAIDWLLLKAKTTEGPGIFAKVTYIQRVNTVGGKAPTTPGAVVGEEVRVPYTADYYFYRAQH